MSHSIGPVSIANDGNLFERLKAGDQSAWFELFEQCNPKLLRALKRKLRENPKIRPLKDSQDFANDVWKSLYNNWDRLHFENVGAVVAFMRTDAMCKVVDEWRRQKATKRDISRQKHIDSIVNESGQALEVASHDPTPSMFAVAKETHERLLQDQPPEAQEVINLSFEGHSKNEIAKKKGCSVRSVQRFFHGLSSRMSGLRGEETR